jgi:hypothetical protein
VDISDAVRKYSKQEYLELSSLLLDECGFRHPSEGWIEVERWIREIPEIEVLMQEHAKFAFTEENMVLRVMLSHFISFVSDKGEHPEVFCWPGHWKSSELNFDNTKSLWLKHLSLFSDREDNGGIFIRRFPGKDSKDLSQTLDTFFGYNLIYDLSRQWVLKDGDFVFDFGWLATTNDKDQWKKWAGDVFSKQYGVTLSDINV